MAEIKENWDRRIGRREHLRHEPIQQRHESIS